MTHLIRKGMTPCDYICGKQGGVRWSFITDIPEDKVLTLHSKFINMEINKKRRTWLQPFLHIQEKYLKTKLSIVVFLNETWRRKWVSLILRLTKFSMPNALWQKRLRCFSKLRLALMQNLYWNYKWNTTYKQQKKTHHLWSTWLMSEESLHYNH